jgi:putative membrane protein
MRSTPFIAAISMGLALAACSKKTETTTETTVNSDMNAASMGASTTNAGAPTTALPAQQFADTVAASDMFEIQSGKLAETMGSTAAVKAFGKQLVTDHAASSANLKNQAAKTTPVVALPMVLPADLKDKITALKATSGAAFDKLFVEQQIEGHQKAVDALKAYAAGGDQASLKEFATTATPIVQGHLTALQAMPK